MNCRRISSLPQKPESGSSETRTSACQREREQIIHRICLGIKRGLERGESLQALVRRAALRHNGCSFKSDPQRKLSLCQSTLLRAWYLWKNGGEVPCAVRHQYKPAGPSVPAWVVLRYLDLVSRVEFPNMRAAWDATEQRVLISYGQLAYHFGGKNFREAQARLIAVADAQSALAEFRWNMWDAIDQRVFVSYELASHFVANFREAQARLKAITDAQSALAEFRLSMAADIRRRLPDRPQRKRRSGAEFSLQFSA